MKIKFIFPNKSDGSLNQVVTVKCNPKFIYEFKNEKFSWLLLNHLKSKTVFLVGSYNNGKKYWCNSLAFNTIFKAVPRLKSNEIKFNKRGFHKRILEALFNTMKIKDSVKVISKDNWKQYLQTTFKE